MSKHTPGPWSVVEHDHAICIQTESPSKTKYGASRYAAIGGFDRNDRAQLEEARANARLIAAAPELLEACKTLAEWLRREDAGFDHATHNRDTKEGEAEWRKWYDENLELCATAQEQARAAIAKATGEKA